MSRKALAIFALALLPATALAQDAPTTDEVLLALGDVSLGLDGVQIRNSLATDGGGSALLQLNDGTLVDVRMVPVADGWSVRDVSLIAGSADSFRGWSSPWRDRVEAAGAFLAGMETTEVPARSAEELAPLSWFEDPDESSRLWGMNPVTYRMMQTLQMMPVLTGPTGGGSLTNPAPRRDDQ